MQGSRAPGSALEKSTRENAAGAQRERDVFPPNHKDAAALHQRCVAPGDRARLSGRRCSKADSVGGVIFDMLCLHQVVISPSQSQGKFRQKTDRIGGDSSTGGSLDHMTPKLPSKIPIFFFFSVRV